MHNSNVDQQKLQDFFELENTKIASLEILYILKVGFENMGKKGNPLKEPNGKRLHTNIHNFMGWLISSVII